MAEAQVTENVMTLMGGYKQKIIDYINGFQGSDNKKLQDYISEFNVHPETEVRSIVHFPVDPKKNQYTAVENEITVQTKVDIKLMGLAFRMLSVEIAFPAVIFGPSSMVPRIIFRAPTPRSWPGHFGLYFNPDRPDLTGWYPYENPVLRAKEIQENMIEGLVDTMCDVLNSYEIAPALRLAEGLKVIYSKKVLPVFQHQSKTDASIKNRIPVPIYIEYDEDRDESWLIMETYATREYWTQPQTVALMYFEHLAEATNYFDDQGELFEDGPHLSEFGVGEKGALKKKRTVKTKSKDYADANPFQQAEQVERDAFGFVIKRADGDFALDAQDAETRRMEEIKKKREEKAALAAEKAKRIEVDVSMYRDSSDWYERNMTRQFTLRGSPEGMSFRDKGDYNLLFSFNPPFILQFIRDQVKIKKNLLTTKKAAEWLFECHKKGFLMPLE